MIYQHYFNQKHLLIFAPVFYWKIYYIIVIHKKAACIAVHHSNRQV